MAEYPIVVREIGGRNRLGVEEAEEFDANLRPVITEGYERIDVQDREDGERVGTVVGNDEGTSVVTVRWDD